MNNKEMNEQDKKILQNRLKQRRLFLNLTYQDLADKTGISKSTLQRYETGGIQNLPYDKIFALSEALEVSPEYFTDLSKDYTDQPIILQEYQEQLKYQGSIFSRNDRSEYIDNVRKFEEKALEKITPKLIGNGYRVEQRERGSVGDLVAIKGSEIWHLDFLFVRDVNSHPVGLGMQRHQLLMRFGRLSVYDKPITKYSIVIQYRAIAEQLIQRFKPIHLNIDMSIILLSEDGFEELYF